MASNFIKPSAIATYVHVHLYLIIATSQAFDCSDKHVHIILLLGNVQ